MKVVQWLCILYTNQGTNSVPLSQESQGRVGEFYFESSNKFGHKANIISANGTNQHLARFTVIINAQSLAVHARDILTDSLRLNAELLAITET